MVINVLDARDEKNLNFVQNFGISCLRKCRVISCGERIVPLFAEDSKSVLRLVLKSVSATFSIH